MPISVAYLLGLPVLTPSDVLLRLDHMDFFVFDSNPERVFLTQHIPGARHLNPVNFSDSELPSDRFASLLFYSSGPLCGAGTHAALRARKMGYRHVYVMTAGISGWIKEGCPVEKG